MKQTTAAGNDSKQTPSRRRRELHIRIGRSRRRIDRRLNAAQAGGRELLSWRNYVERYPGWSLAAALAAGFAVSAGPENRKIRRWLRPFLVRQATDELLRFLGTEFRRIWSKSTSRDR